MNWSIFGRTHAHYFLFLPKVYKDNAARKNVSGPLLEPGGVPKSHWGLRSFWEAGAGLLGTASAVFVYNISGSQMNTQSPGGGLLVGGSPRWRQIPPDGWGVLASELELTGHHQGPQHTDGAPSAQWLLDPGALEGNNCCCCCCCCCCAACGSLVPQWGMETVLSPGVEVRSLNHWTTREVPELNCFCCWEGTLPTLEKPETNTTITPRPTLCNTSHISPHPSLLPPDISAGPLEFHSRTPKHRKGRQELFPRSWSSLQAPWLSTLSLKQREQQTLLTPAGPSWEETVFLEDAHPVPLNTLTLYLVKPASHRVPGKVPVIPGGGFHWILRGMTSQSSTKGCNKT